MIILRRIERPHRRGEIPVSVPEILLSTGWLVCGQVRLWLVFDIGRLGLRALFALVVVVVVVVVLAIRRHDAKIVLGVLKISFGGYTISRNRSVPCEGKVFVHDLACIAAGRRAIVSASLGPMVSIVAAIAAPLRSLRIGTLSHSIRVQTHPFLGSTIQTANSDHERLPELADAVTGWLVW